MGVVLLAFVAGGCGSSSTSLTGPSVAKCGVTVGSAPPTAPASGGAGTIAISTSRDCTWAASSSNTWIVITSPSSGQGDGTIAYRVAANSDHAARRGTLAVNDQQLTIAQDAAACQYALDVISSTVPPNGGAVTVRVSADGPCGWTAASNASWITIVSGPSGSGGGTVTINVAANAGGARTGTLTIAGQTFTVAQSQATPDCSASIAPASQNFGAAGGTGSLTLTTGGACSWTATSTADWVTIAGRSTGSGSGQVSFSVAANPNAASRRATIAVAGQTFTVAQDGMACAYTIAPVSQTIGATGGTISVSVTTAPMCGWSAASQASWIGIASGASGTGNGTVTITVDATSGGSRTGAVTIAGQTFSVTQAAPSCSYAINPSAQALGASGGSGSVAVSAGSSCAWTAAASDSWITVTAGSSGTGNGTVAYSVSANPGAARTGTLTIAGQTFTVTQAAQACTFAIAPAAQSVPASGGTASVAVTAPAGCGWTSVSNAPWITVTTGASGSGNGTVGLSVAPTSDAPRTGTVTIAGQTFTVNEAAQTCSFAIAPTNRSVDASGGPGTVAVTAGNSCAWTATANDSWIAITGGGSGTGNGTVGYSVAPNSGAPRSGTVTIAGQTFTLTQSAPAQACAYTIAPTSQPMPASGGSASVSVSAGDGCSWTSASNAPWITVTAGGAGTGAGTVGLSVAATTGAARSGTVTIAGQTFTVNQAAAPCTFSISPTSQAFTATGGNGTVSITASDPGCSWTATADAPWITITSPATGSGNGTIAFSVAPNSGADRNATVTIGGQTFTVTQTQTH